jgi:hypothetical protein
MLDSWKKVGKGEALGNPILARVRGGAADIARSGINGEWQVLPALSEIYLHSKPGYTVYDLYERESTRVPGLSRGHAGACRFEEADHGSTALGCALGGWEDVAVDRAEDFLACVGVVGGHVVNGLKGRSARAGDGFIKVKSCSIRADEGMSSLSDKPDEGREDGAIKAFRALNDDEGLPVGGSGRVT